MYCSEPPIYAKGKRVEQLYIASYGQIQNRAEPPSTPNQYNRLALAINCAHQVYESSMQWNNLLIAILQSF